jgi:DNA-binding transcriptional MerR regulator
MLGHDTQPFESPHQDLYRIGEVSRLTETKPFVLRYWESEFPMLQPVKTPKGHRLYRSEDIDMVRAIKRLLYDEGFTIAGARRHLADHGSATESAGASGSGPGNGNGHGEGNGDEQSQATENGIGSSLAPPVAPPAARRVLRELRTELAAILTLLRAQ